MAWWNRGATLEPPTKEVTLEQMLSEFDVVQVDHGSVLVTEKPQGKKLAAVQDVKTNELGVATDTLYSRFGASEYNPDLRGYMGLRKWDEMRRSDGSAKGALRLIKAPIFAARWFVQPASQSSQDVKVSEFISDALFKRMTMSWPQLLTEISLHLDFGYYAFEKVFMFEDGKNWWRKWAPRHPMSIYEWVYDAHGGPMGIEAYADTETGRIFIPIEKLLAFTNEKEAGNMEGISILRPAYKHWFFADTMYKIDAIQKERHGIGVPVIKLPPGFTPADKALAEQLGRNLRTNEKANIVLPPMWDIMTLKIEGQSVDALASAKFHREQIYSTILADFMVQGGSTKERIELFNKATRFVADQIRDVINKWAIPELVNLNWRSVDDYPELRVRRIGETVDWQKISMALRNMIGASIIKPDDPLEAWVRDEMDLPLADPTTAREAATPQNPAGPPKQSTTNNMRGGKDAGSARVGQPSGNSGGGGGD